VAVDSGTSALFLSLTWARKVDPHNVIEIPRNTFYGVPMMAVHTGFNKIVWTNEPWSGQYQLKPTPVIDSALRFCAGMYCDGFVCLSFQSRKLLPIGRGGMILHDSAEADVWFRRARFFGRSEVPIEEDPGAEFPGWKMYMLPDEAARGLTLMQYYPQTVPDQIVNYPDISCWNLWEKYV